MLCPPSPLPSPFCVLGIIFTICCVLSISNVLHCITCVHGCRGGAWLQLVLLKVQVPKLQWSDLAIYLKNKSKTKPSETNSKNQMVENRNDQSTVVPRLGGGGAMTILLQYVVLLALFYCYFVDLVVCFTEKLNLISKYACTGRTQYIWTGSICPWIYDQEAPACTIFGKARGCFLQVDECMFRCAFLCMNVYAWITVTKWTQVFFLWTVAKRVKFSVNYFSASFSKF